MDDFDLDSFLGDIGMEPSLDTSTWGDTSGFGFGDISNAVQGTDFSGADFGNIDQMLQGVNLDDIMASLDLGNIGTDLGPSSSMGMDPYLLEDLGLSSLGNAGTSGYYDEETGKFIPSAYGQLQAPLDEKSGTNVNSMDGYTYDKKSGTWTTPEGKTYTPDVKPTGTAKSGAQVMVDSGALPKGYGGLTPTPGSTATTTNTGGGGIAGAIKNALGGGSGAGAKSGMDPMTMLMLLMMLSQANKGGSSGSTQSTIPQLSANRSQLPYSKPSRPGAGGVNYFSPTTYAPRMAGGGMAMAGGGGISDLGGYSDGGRLLKGPGDGVSDDIPATIAGKQPARLADGEFVVPARIVSELGNGSTDAGADKLYAMMDRIQNERRKTKNVAADTKAAKHLPA